MCGIFATLENLYNNGFLSYKSNIIFYMTIIKQKATKTILSGIKYLSLLSFLGIFLISCTVPEALKPKKVSKDRPIGANERARQNIEQGRGISLKNMTGRKSTTYEFSTSNPLWRASLETIDFMPLATVDYSGGIIITDWYSDTSSNNDSIKITVRFLSNEIRSDGIKIIVHRKICNNNLDCTTSLMKSNSIENELRSTILKKAALFERADKKKK